MFLFNSFSLGLIFAKRHLDSYLDSSDVKESVKISAESKNKYSVFPARKALHGNQLL